MSATALVVAFTGGTVSLLSPCVLPVVPAYLSVTTGLGLSVPAPAPGAQPEPTAGAVSNVEPHPDAGRRSSVTVATRTPGASPGRPATATILRGGLLFVAGFSVVFVLLGLSATAIGSLLLRHQVPVTRASGLVVVGMALVLLASTLSLRWVPGREFRFQLRVSRHGVWVAPVAGAAFAFGWTPCIGPVLGSVLAVAADQTRLAQGAALLAMYSAGLAVPLLIIGSTFHRSLVAVRFLRRHSIGLTRASAAVLAAYGTILALDQFSWVVQRLQHAAGAVGLSWLVGLG
jgi:cytochrome c-type biogenesis protein